MSVCSWQSGSSSLLRDLSRVISFLSAIAAHTVTTRGHTNTCVSQMLLQVFRLGSLFSPLRCVFSKLPKTTPKNCFSHFQTFKREGNDLFINHKIGLVEALCGCQFLIKHLDGRQIVVKYPAGKVIEPGPLSLAPLNCCQRIWCNILLRPRNPDVIRRYIHAKHQYAHLIIGGRTGVCVTCTDEWSLF